MPDLSILTSVHRTGRYLAEMLRSVERQTPDTEILIASNGAENHADVEAAIDDVVPDGARIFYRDATAPLVVALNEMLGKAQSDYVMRLDPDDKLPDGSLETALKHAEPGRVVYGNYQDFGGADRVIYCRQATPGALYRHSVGPYNYVMPTEIARALGGWREAGYEDWDLLVRLIEAGLQSIPVNEILLLHRVRADGRSARLFQSYQHQLDRIRQANADFFNARGFPV